MRIGIMAIRSQMALQIKPVAIIFYYLYLKVIIIGIDKNDLNIFNDGNLQLAPISKISTISTYSKYVISNVYKIFEVR